MIKKKSLMLIIILAITIILIGYLSASFYKKTSCVNSLRSKYNSNDIDNDTLIVGFTEPLNTAEMNSFAAEYNLEVENAYANIPYASFQITDENNVFNKICELRKDRRVNSTEPNSFVYAQSA